MVDVVKGYETDSEILDRDTKSSIPDEYKKLIWFLYPQEVAKELKKFNE